LLRINYILYNFYYFNKIISISIKVRESIHGGKLLSVNIFLYILNKNYKRKRDNQNVFYWTCSTKCGAKLCAVETSNGELKIDEKSTFSENQHSHSVDPIAVEASINIKC